MATTTNFGWETPDDTDLVKDGALAMRTLGNAIDASMVDLKGGTTGQVLSKASNTDMDFTWVAQDDSNAIQNAIVDAKGDLIAASAADTPARLAVGNDGETLVADSSQSTGLRWGNNYGFTAGKNCIINGDFRINQRAFTSATSNGSYGFDRFYLTTTDGTTTYSAQTFTAGSAPVAGYEAINFARIVSTGQTLATAQSVLRQAIEDVRKFAGQTVTVSFWARSGSGTPAIAVELIQDFGSGGSTAVTGTISTKQTISTSWVRYTWTGTLPSISGKTIGSNSNLQLAIWCSAGSNFDARTQTLGIQSNTFDIWGVQVEAGNVATAFQTATGTLAGELAACNYYFKAFGGNQVYEAIPSFGTSRQTTTHYVNVALPKMRTTPSFSFSAAGDWQISIAGLASQECTNLSLSTTESGPDCALLTCTTASNANFGSDKFVKLVADNTTSARLFFSAEL